MEPLGVASLAGWGIRSAKRDEKAGKAGGEQASVCEIVHNDQSI